MGRRALGELEQIVLLAIVGLGDEAYGASIHREIEERTGRDVAIGSIYTALDRLEGRAAVASRVGAPTGERGGRRRKLYSLMPNGKEDLGRALRTMRAMTRDMDDALDTIVEGGR